MASCIFIRILLTFCQLDPWKQTSLKNTKIFIEENAFANRWACAKDITPLVTHWSYVFLALTYRNTLFKMSSIVFICLYHSFPQRRWSWASQTAARKRRATVLLWCVRRTASPSLPLSGSGPVWMARLSTCPVSCQRGQTPGKTREMETFLASLALSEGNPPVTGGFPTLGVSDVGLWCLLCC